MPPRTHVWLILFTLVVAALGLLAPSFAADSDGGKVIEPFNGKDLTGWHYPGEPDDALKGKTESTDGRYTAKDGVIVINASSEPDARKRIRQLWTVQEFPKDFELRLEF